MNILKRYTNVNYGNRLDFSNGEYNLEDKTVYLRDDKNTFVRFACRLRKYKKQIKSFQKYINDPEQGVWVLEMTATPSFHKTLAEALKNPAPILEQWAKEDEERYKAYLESVGEDEGAIIPDEDKKPVVGANKGIVEDSTPDKD